MYRLPKKLADFTPYEPLTGDYRIRLDVNESFIEIPTEEVVRAVMDIDRLKLNRYPDPYATKAVTAFAELFNVDFDCVTAGNGSDELIGLICAGLLEKGSKVLTFEYDFSMYNFYAKLYELEVLTLEKDDNFEVDIDEVIDFVKQNGVKCIIFSNPCNPTSLGIEKPEIERLVRELSETGVLVVLDEAYMDFWSDQSGSEAHSMLGDVENNNNLIVLRTCSKSVALAGIRMGFAVTNKRITRALKTVKSPFNVNSLTQSIAAAILSDEVGYKKSIEFIKKSTRDLYEACKGLAVLGVFERVFKTKTNFVFCETEQAEEIYEYLLEQGIAVRCFGDYLRICAGTREEMNELARALASWKVGDLGEDL
jgi:histidinol-phosphate aminotransferase